MRKSTLMTGLACAIAATVTIGALAQDKPKEKKHTTSSGLEYVDHVVGTGDVAKEGSEVAVNYTGWLYVKGKRGDQFDTSVGKAPFVFRIGNHEAITGWDEGITGMKVGGKRELIVPPSLGYGSRGNPKAGIAPNATLDFEVELIAVKK